MLSFDNSFARLPERFYARVTATEVAEPRLLKLNEPLAEWLGLDVKLLTSEEGARILAGNRVPESANPIALAYAGHQFGVFVPRLGDGRAILLGEVVTKDGQRRDIQLKGSGRTPFSRGGDGRAALGPVLREYIVSEAMHALGIPTTRALAAVTTGEPVVRDQVLPGAILTRVAASHIRVGTFQYFASRGDHEALEILTKYALERHYPHAKESGNDALALLERVIDAQANLVAKWLGVGFVHGVMNTDNTTISGETIDFGPCAFLDEYDPERAFSSIDHGGRYAFSNQPRIALWNLARLAEALLPLIAKAPDDAIRVATERLDQFTARFEEAHRLVMRAKLGLTKPEESDEGLIGSLLSLLAAHRVDYTVFFRGLCAVAEGAEIGQITRLFGSGEGAIREWVSGWQRRVGIEPISATERASSMRRANPALIPRNHRVEEALSAAVRESNLEPFETLVHALSNPFHERPEHRHLAEPPGQEQREYVTFCGT